MRRCALTALIFLPACFADPRAGDAFSTGGSGSGESMTTSGESDDTSSSSTETGSTTDGTCMVDDDCGGDNPLCDDGECVACTELGIGGCQNRDPLLPACNTGSGACVECNDGQQDLCGGDTPACTNNECSPCVSNDQCESGACLFESGECLQVSVDIEGIVFQFTENIGEPVEVDSVTAINVDPAPSDTSVDVDGMYSLSDIPAFSLVDLDVVVAQTSPVMVFTPATHTVSSTVAQNVTPFSRDIPHISYAEMSRIAFECMPDSFVDLADAQGTSTGNSNTLFISRSTVFGQLLDASGDPLPEISNLAISVELNGWTNTHRSEAETAPPDPQLPEPDPTTVCWLEEGGDDKLHVVANQQSASGRFVMFRVRNGNGVGAGLATVNIVGYDSATVNLSSSGNIGYVEMLRNEESVDRDFERDIYPIFTQEGCAGCHTNGGPVVMGMTVGQRDGFAADWSLGPDEVYDNLTGPGTTCETLTGGDTTPENRICTDAPGESLFIRRPTAEVDPCTDAATDCGWQYDQTACETDGTCRDVHPVDIFPSEDNPTVQSMLEWVSQGAARGTGIGTVEWEADIYPIFTNQGCIGCHVNGGPPDGMGGVKGERDGVAADWSLSAAEVYANMTGPGTTCLTLTGGDTTLENRVCTDDVDNSLFVIRPLVDPPMSTDPHPVVIFPTIDHPDMAKIRGWIGQGAIEN